MKPVDLKSPFSWDKRHIVVSRSCLVCARSVRRFHELFFSRLAPPRFFSPGRPVCIEYCSGNGAWIAAKAEEQPEYNWVAVEKKFERVRKIWSKIKNSTLPNLLAVCGEGLRTTQHYIPHASVRAVYINFPDPWPKRRHSKHRIVEPLFVKEIHRILEPGGILTMVTDDESYSRHMIRTLLHAPGFQSEFPEPYYLADYPGYGTSYFEDLWREKGKIIRYHAFRKIS